jgi:creatinine amidohydrolase
MGTDTLTAIAVAHDAAKVSGTLLASPLWYGWSPQHMCFPGTVSLRPETVTGLMTDVGLSLVHHGFRRLVVVNGHRFANIAPLSLALNKVRQTTGALAVLVDLAHIAGNVYSEWSQDPESGGFGHADGYETAHMLYLHPELVEMQHVASATGVGHNPFKALDPWTPSNRAAYWPSTAAENARSEDGALGNPHWATTERGEALHKALVADLVEMLASIRDEPVEVTRPDYPS